jgi:glutathione S-transferase
MNADATGRVLYLTPLSHFSRKVRIVLRELDLACDESYVPNLLSADPADFGGNPILRVPVLRDGPHWVVESDQIVRYVLEAYDRGSDRFAYFSMGAAQRNALSIVSAIMGAEVELLLSRRSGLVDHAGALYFRRYREVIEHGLAWLERDGAGIWPEMEFSYLDIALLCMWDHIRYNGLLDDAGRYPWIDARTSRHAARPSVAATAPEQMQSLQWELYPSQRPSTTTRANKD